MARHPDIEIVDLHALVEKEPLYATWWELEDVHFTPTLAEPLGRAIAARVMEILEAREGYAGKRGLLPPRPLSVEQIESQKCCLPPDVYQKLLGQARTRAEK